MEEYEEFIKLLLGEELTFRLTNDSIKVNELCEVFDRSCEQILQVFNNFQRLTVVKMSEFGVMNEFRMILGHFSQLNGFTVGPPNNVHNSIAEIIGLGRAKGWILRFFLSFFMYINRHDYDNVLKQWCLDFDWELSDDGIPSDHATSLHQIFQVSEMLKIEVDLYGLRDGSVSITRIVPANLRKQEIICVLENFDKGQLSYHPLLYTADIDHIRIWNMHKTELRKPRIYSFSRAGYCAEKLTLQPNDDPRHSACLLFKSHSLKLHPSVLIPFHSSDKDFQVSVEDLTSRPALSGLQFQVETLEISQQTELAEDKRGIYALTRKRNSLTNLTEEIIKNRANKLDNSISSTTGVEMLLGKDAYVSTAFTCMHNEIPLLGKLLSDICVGTKSNSHKGTIIVGQEGSIYPLSTGPDDTNQIVINFGPSCVEARLLDKMSSAKLHTVLPMKADESQNVVDCLKGTYASQGFLEYHEIASEIVVIPKNHVLKISALSSAQFVFAGFAVVAMQSVHLQENLSLPDPNDGIESVKLAASKNCEIHSEAGDASAATSRSRNLKRKRPRRIVHVIADDEPCGRNPKTKRVRVEENGKEGPVTGRKPDQLRGRVLASKKVKKTHVIGRDKGSDGRWHCSCGNRYIQKQHLHRHLKTATNGKLLECSVCSKTFGEKSDLDRHERAVHKKERLQCEHCEKNYAYRKNLVSHCKLKHPSEGLP